MKLLDQINRTLELARDILALQSRGDTIVISAQRREIENLKSLEATRAKEWGRQLREKNATILELETQLAESREAAAAGLARLVADKRSMLCAFEDCDQQPAPGSELCAAHDTPAVRAVTGRAKVSEVAP